MAQNKHTLIFGGGAHGMMGAVARGCHRFGGEIIGVAPRFFQVDGVLFPHCTEMIYTDTMRQRKQIMEDNADAFIVVPGGIGTFEEFFEILTLKQLCRHNKPIAIYNIKNYYSDLNTLMEAAIEKNFVHENCRSLYTVTDDMQKLLEYIEAPVSNDFTVNELKEG
jgi:uncharacterized protein (TIGR00730 family)